VTARRNEDEESLMADDRIQPLIIGRGMAGQALRHALSLFPEEIAPSRWLERGDPLPAPDNPATALLVVAGPHALHTPRLLEAAERGYRYAICEKPQPGSATATVSSGGLGS
jgi:hypothetical protein